MTKLVTNKAAARRSVGAASPADPGAAAQLRAAGVKVTVARLRVLEALGLASQPVCHAELETQLVTLDRVTLYRVLDSLVACGLAVKAPDDRGVFRFSTAAAREQHAGHAHFRCTACGSVFCLDSPAPPPPKLPRGFQAAEVEVDVLGTCVNCNGGGNRKGKRA